VNFLNFLVDSDVEIYQTMHGVDPRARFHI